MIYTKESPHYNPNFEVIKLTLDVNREHYPDFPSEIFVSEYNFDSVIAKLSGLDYSIKEKLNMSDDDYNKTWICWGVKAEHTTDDKYFGINGNTINFHWK